MEPGMKMEADEGGQSHTGHLQRGLLRSRNSTSRISGLLQPRRVPVSSLHDAASCEDEEDDDNATPSMGSLTSSSLSAVLAYRRADRSAASQDHDKENTAERRQPNPFDLLTPLPRRGTTPSAALPARQPLGLLDTPYREAAPPPATGSALKRSGAEPDTVEKRSLSQPRCYSTLPSGGARKTGGLSRGLSDPWLTGCKARPPMSGAAERRWEQTATPPEAGDRVDSVQTPPEQMSSAAANGELVGSRTPSVTSDTVQRLTLQAQRVALMSGSMATPAQTAPATAAVHPAPVVHLGGGGPRTRLGTPRPQRDVPSSQSSISHSLPGHAPPPLTPAEVVRPQRLMPAPHSPPLPASVRAAAPAADGRSTLSAATPSAVRSRLTGPPTSLAAMSSLPVGSQTQRPAHHPGTASLAGALAPPAAASAAEAAISAAVAAASAGLRVAAASASGTGPPAAPVTAAASTTNADDTGSTTELAVAPQPRDLSQDSTVTAAPSSCVTLTTCGTQTDLVSDTSAMPPPNTSLLFGKRVLKPITVSGQEYIVVKQIGRGGSSKVYEVLDNSMRLLALKQVFLETADVSTAKGYMNEIDLLRRLKRSDRVIRLVDFEHNEEKQMLFILMERGETDLSGLLRTYTKLNEVDANMCKFFWGEMLRCVDVIHTEGIIHLDLKPSNFLMVSGRLKLIDFGIASRIQNDCTSVIKDTQVGTFNYMSPEAIEAQQVTRNGTSQTAIKISRRSDVWSLGCILYYFVYGVTPFGHIKQMIGKLTAIVSPHHAISFAELADRQLLAVLKACLQRDPYQRPDIHQLLSHPYLVGLPQ